MLISDSSYLRTTPVTKWFTSASASTSALTTTPPATVTKRSRGFFFSNDFQGFQFKDARSLKEKSSNGEVSAATSSLIKSESSHKRIENQEVSKQNRRLCASCNLQILYINWCVYRIRSKHDLGYRTAVCCFHPQVLSKDVRGISCKCCKLGISGYCQWWRPKCYPR